MPAPIIEVDHVTKEFRLGQLTSLGQSLRNGISRLRGQPVAEREPFKALDDMSFSVQPGEVLGIIGHNGAGKSTLLKTLAGISQPTRGKVRVNGRVAPLIEVGAGLVPDMTGRENVFLNASILGMKRREIKRKFEEIVAFAELEEFIDTPVKRYSSGMQVRLGFAIATAIESEILIVDEVLAVGDLAFQRKCFDRMEDLIRRQQRTVLLVSHNIRQVERLCSRVMMLERGRPVCDGAPGQVCEAFYSASNRQIERIAAMQSQGRRESSGDVDLNSVSMLDDFGHPISELQYLQTVEFVISYVVHRKIPEPIFGVGVHTTDFLYLSTSQSVGKLNTGSLIPGTYEVRLRVLRFPFLPGVYSLRLGLAIGDTFQSLFYGENLMPLLVTSRAIGPVSTSHVNDGFVELETEWQFSQLERPSASVEKA